MPTSKQFRCERAHGYNDNIIIETTNRTGDPDDDPLPGHRTQDERKETFHPR